MAIKTKIRATHLSATMPSDSESAGVSTALAVSDLGGILNHMGSAIKRIHGNTTWTAGAAGTFYQDLVVGGTTPTLTIGDGDAEDAKLVINSAGSDFQFGVDNDENTTLRISTSDFDGTAEVAELSAATAAFVGDVTSAATIQPAGDTAAGDAAAIGYTAAEGIIITGQGSTNDVTIKNDADAAVIQIPTGTTQTHLAGSLNAASADIVGDVVAATFIPDGDTAAGDGAAVGYTAAEGIIITGQGSTSDVTIKNDADATVLEIKTGTTQVDLAGNLLVGGNVIKASDGGSTITMDTSDNVTIAGDLTVTGNDIKGSGGTVVTFSGTDTSLAADLTVLGGKVTLTNGATVDSETSGKLKLTEDLVECSADLTVLGNDLDFAAGAANIGASVGNAALTLGGSNTTVTIPGNLDINGTTTTIDTTNMSIEDRIIGLGVSGSSGNYSNLNTGIVFGYGNKTDTQPAMWYDGTVFNVAKSATSPASASFAAPAAAEYVALVAGHVSPGASNTYSLGASAVQWSDLFLGEGGVINWDNGDLTLTQANNVLTLAGGGLVSDVDVSSNTLTTSAAQNLAIMQGAGANVDIGAFDLQAQTLSADSLTATRVVFAGADGVLSDDSDMVFATDTLTVTKLGAFEAAGAINFANQAMTNVDVNSGAIDGTAIGANTHTTGKFTTVDATTDFTIDGLVLTADTITNDSNLAVVSTGLTLNASLDIALSADGGNVTMDDGQGVTVFDFDVDDPAMKIMDDAQVANYYSVAVGANGATTMSTVDADAAAANLIITADGTVDIDSAGLMTLDSGGGINLEPAAGSTVLIDGVVTIDAGVVTGVTSLTATAIDGVIGGDTARAGTFTTLDCTDGAFALANLDIDGGTDIGAALVDADLFIVDDSANGTNRKCAMSRLKTYLVPQKVVLVQTNATAAKGAFDTTITAFQAGADALQDVYVNGQLMTKGANDAADMDWYPHASTDGQIHFEFALEAGDVVTCILRQV